MKLVSVDVGSADHFGLCLSAFAFIWVIFLVRLSIILKYGKASPNCHLSKLALVLAKLENC